MAPWDMTRLRPAELDAMLEEVRTLNQEAGKARARK